MRKAKSLRLNIILITLFLFISILIITHNVSALEYQSNTGFQFTINPTITINITGDHNGNLVINNLTPSNASDSNIINIVTESNAISGYSLYSTVGNSTNNSTELRKDGTDTTNKFSSITTNKTSLSDFNGSDWGYSYCNGDNTICTTSSDNWVSGNTDSTLSGYNGLPLYDSSSNNNNGSNNTAGIKLVDTTTSGTTTISFKIGAKASNSQIAGDYTNTINFIGVAKSNPQPIYMQEATLADCGKSMVDSRDNNVYSTTLLSNGQCWMTKNLDLPGGTKLTANDTDMSAEYEAQGLPTTNGFLADNKLPVSSQVGFNDTTKAFVYNSNKTDNCSSAPGCSSYYSWTAATLGSGLNIAANNADAPYSICPKGWHLPNTRTGIDSTSDFRALAIFLGGSSGVAFYGPNSTPTGAEMYGLFYNSTLKPSPTGQYSDSSFGSGGTYYWSATSASTSVAHNFYADTSYVVFAYDFYRKYGFPVRCLLDSE